jgi:hypothetical protein
LWSYLRNLPDKGRKLKQITKHYKNINMKTFIKNLLAASLIIITSAAFASTPKNNNLTVLTEVKNINKIVITGNVEVLLVQAPTESVKVYDSYYSKNALVQQKDDVLRVSSFEKERLTVAIYVRNLSSIEASNNSTVKTVGKVSFLSLDVVLKDKASADINSNTVDLFTSVKDNASLKLTGQTTDHYASIASQAKLSMDQFAADCTSVNAIAQVYAAKVKVATGSQSLENLIITDELELAK